MYNLNLKPPINHKPVNNEAKTCTAKAWSTQPGFLKPKTLILLLQRGITAKSYSELAVWEKNN